MSEQKLIEVAKWLNSKGYYTEFETDELWMEDELTKHRFRDICELLDEYAHDRIRTVAHEAVEEVNEINKSVGLGKNILEFTRGTSAYILTRIKSKL